MPDPSQVPWPQTFINTTFTKGPLPARLTRFTAWLLKTALIDIPEGLVDVTGEHLSESPNLA